MKIIGHRGAKGLAPENTLLAFAKALEHHVDEIEFDVRVTKDNVPVILHDSSASDVAGNTLAVSDSTYAELKAHKSDLATLEEALQFIDAKVHVLVEVKQGERVPPIAKVLGECLDSSVYQNSDLSLGSFSQKTLRELHKALPDIEKVVIERWSGVKASFRCRQVNTKRVNMKYLWLWKGFLHSMQRGGYQIAPYTMNNPAKVKKWQPYLYGVITDYPDLFEK